MPDYANLNPGQQITVSIVAGIIIMSLIAVAIWLFTPAAGAPASRWTLAWRWFVAQVRLAIMSFAAWVMSLLPATRMRGSRDSHAVEPHTEQSGTSLVEQLEQLTDDELLDILARVRAGDDWRWADSRIAKFVGGRTEDRVAAVREVRGKDALPAPPAPPVRTIMIRGGGQPIAIIPVE